ncbi:MAG: JAB domain-containing protein [Lachnoclostridium sp.]|nr:JAB domain-containing protein [Lachnoclostridium sp.]
MNYKKEDRNNGKTMKTLPQSERPYEKAVEYGVESLSDAELLAVILRTGTKDKSARDLAEEILKLGNPSGLPGLLHHSLADYKEIRGIGTVKAIQLSCIGELSKRIWKSAKVTSELVCRNPSVIAEYFMEEMRHKEQEYLKMLILNTKNVLMKDVDISKGTVNASLATPREIYIEALKYRGSSVILLHNHPSGDPAPSNEDCLFTKRVAEAGKLIGISLLDHIIIGDNTYVSLKERGIL